MTEQGFGFAGVSVPFLNAFYKIQSNRANASFSQAVFETGGQKFSQKDLKQFQTEIGLPQQPAVDKKGFSNTDTCISAAYPDSNNPDCYEGNLDLQFLMGIAQQTSTIFWYEASSNPFLTWIISVSNTKKPPLANSISWGTIEQVCGLSCALFMTPLICCVTLVSIFL
jgi:hypothetical protein